MNFPLKKALKHKILASKTNILLTKLKYFINSKVFNNYFSHEFYIFGQPLHIIEAKTSFSLQMWFSEASAMKNNLCQYGTYTCIS